MGYILEVSAGIWDTFRGSSRYMGYISVTCLSDVSAGMGYLSVMPPGMGYFSVMPTDMGYLSDVTAGIWDTFSYASRYGTPL
jgi:hypothetical protein